MSSYWPLGVFILILAAILGMSQYADSSKRKYEESHSQTKTAPVAKDEDRKPGHNTEEAYKPPIWGKYVTFPEGFGAWAIFFTLIAIVWQAIETRKAAETSIKQFAIQRETLSPRIVISNFTNNVFTEAMRGDWVVICMKLSNSGGLPAYGVIAETWTEFITGERPYKFSSNARYRKAAPINVDAATPQAFEIPLNRRLTEVERRQMGNAKGRIAFRIRLTYTVLTRRSLLTIRIRSVPTQWSRYIKATTQHSTSIPNQIRTLPKRREKPKEYLYTPKSVRPIKQNSSES